MKRRDSLKKMILSASGTIFIPTMLSSCSGDDEEIIPTERTESVVIIGAGISGISAAKKLKDNGFKNIIVLEGRDRLGGRIWTDSHNSVPIDLGASWIHGPDGGNPITPLASPSGAATFTTDNDNIKVFDIDGSEYSEDDLDDLDSTYQSLLSQITANGDVNKSFEEVLVQINPNALNDRLIKYAMSSYTEFDSGADTDKLSSKYHDNDEKYPGNDLIITNGYIKIVEHLADGLDIRYNQKVNTIDHSGSQTIVSTDSGNFNADFVVCTAPLGVLKKGYITFNPALSSAKQNALNRMDMGTNNKIALFFENAFWDTSLQYIGYTPEEKGKYNYFLNFRKFSDHNVLMTFGFGGYGIDMEAESDAKVQADIMTHLENIYGNAVEQPTKMIRTSWDSDPFSHGAYTFIPTGSSPDDLNTIAENIDNKIFFAGEHTTEDYIGTVHGAYITGIWQAEDIIDIVNA